MNNKKKLLLISIPALILVAALLIALALSSSIDKSDLSDVLTKYFEAYYATANVASIKECLPSEIKNEADLAYTLGGTVNLLSSYVGDTISQVGLNPKVEIVLKEVSDPTAVLRNQYKAQFAGVTMSVGANFEVKITGDDGSLNFRGSVDFVNIGNKWYLTTYSIPLYENN